MKIETVNMFTRDWYAGPPRAWRGPGEKFILGAPIAKKIFLKNIFRTIISFEVKNFPDKHVVVAFVGTFPQFSIPNFGTFPPNTNISARI
jgi:hypothetical protein